MYKKSTLSNNLRIISREFKDRESVAVGVWVGVGGRFEDDATKGAAHFLEHILFRGSLKYPCHEIKGSIEGVGGSLNAFTGEEQTCFYARVPAKHFDLTIDILCDMVFFPMIQKNDLEKERGIILEEIKMMGIFRSTMFWKCSMPWFGPSILWGRIWRVQKKRSGE